MHSVSHTRALELLAPAKDFAHGQAVLLCGADAIYIGAPKFGARAAAGASIDDIGRLCSLAHTYGAKVYVAMNTLLYEHELKQAVETAWDVYNAGADALIVQDMAFAAIEDMPPIALHASTQMFNSDPKRVEFLAQNGFSRVILERAMSLEDMAAVGRAVDTELEAFVHGAICVCNSGRCYMSLSMGSGRSGNRGDCIQSCRMPYDLLDSDLKPINGFRGKHLLSISDMNRSADIEAMVTAGISSFKIEGRLKDMSYVKNIVSYYRSVLDNIIASDPTLSRASNGVSSINFDPDPAKSFARGATSYFLHGREGKIATLESPKSSGYYVGRVAELGRDYIVLTDQREYLLPGDGVCFYDRDGMLCGTNINSSSGKHIYPNRCEGIAVGTRIFKNFDNAFSTALERSTPRRVMEVEARFSHSTNDITVSMSSCGKQVSANMEIEFSEARNRELARKNIEAQIKKSGHSAFEVVSVEIPDGELPFVAASTLNSLRREALELLERELSKTDRPQRKESRKMAYPYSMIASDDSITNSVARDFYTGRGVESIESALESLRSYEGCKVMNCRYCIRREIGACLKSPNNQYNRDITKGDLYIKTGPHTYKLQFDCKRCEMNIFKYGE